MVTTYTVNRVGLIQMPTQELTAQILAAAIEGFEAEKRRIDEQIAEVRQMLDGGRSEPAAAPKPPGGTQRTMSAAARKRIGDAQRKRWAQSKKPSEQPTQSATTSESPKRKFSAAGRRAIAEATKKRWAAFHAAKEAAAKKTATKKPQKRAASGSARAEAVTA